MTFETHVRAAADRLELEREPVPPAQVAAGSPSTGLAVLGEFAGSEIGVWELTPGVVHDVEADEVFVVLSGCATIDFEDGGNPIEVRAGDVVHLRDGQRTRWTVTETLRKVYVTPLDRES
jgi:uncharacterized cupin superfamily protein